MFSCFQVDGKPVLPLERSGGGGGGVNPRTGAGFAILGLNLVPQNLIFQLLFLQGNQERAAVYLCRECF